MRYLILRRKARAILLVMLLVAAAASIAPWLYCRVFIDQEDLVGPGPAPWCLRAPGFLKEEDINRAVSLDISFLDKGYVFSELHIEGLELKGHLISGNVFLKGRFIDTKDRDPRKFSGKLSSGDMCVDSRPFVSIRGSFEIAGNTMKIKSLRLGKAYKLKGEIGLIPPFETDLRFDVERADIRDLVAVVSPKNPGIALGMMNGVFYIKGALSNIYSNGILESRNGRVGRIEYDVATIRIEGFGPIINIVDSRARWGKSLLTIDGYIDLRNIGKRSLSEGLRVKSDMKTIVWDGWDIDQKGKDALSMTKDISDNMRVGFKAFAREPLTPYRDRENPEEMSLEYKVGAQEYLKMKLKENEEFFGVEHSVKF
ncbi:MAG: hypothetical protein KKA34_03705 [Candidatus Omnitrophica bacterium]|nr:hypothetical protein [Candidatus Omnitrophota bacterium]